MKNNIALSLLSFLLICCSSDDSNTDLNNDGNTTTFSIELSANETAVIDEVVSVTVTSSETMASLEISLDNFQTSTTSYSNLGSSTQRYFSFDKLGSKSIIIKAINSNGDESVQTATVTIGRGNAVKITTSKLALFKMHNGLN